MTDTYQRWYTRKQVAERIGIAYQTLATWHCVGRGPRSQRLGPGLLRYSIDEVLAWEADPVKYEAATAKDRKSTAKSTKRKG
jgi:predicted DNA-binding transcriptional regulator AlpA